LLFTVGKAPFVEAHGCLSEFPITNPASVFGSTEIDQVADHIINGDERLRRDLANFGSCDCSYALKDLARFRVNIFKQKRNYLTKPFSAEPFLAAVDEVIEESADARGS
jgi:Tfp pilus assembly pilus retraction ATPase PilT